jgi:3-oxo-5-alpha-steroid 4-dehydrogenase 3
MWIGHYLVGCAFYIAMSFAVIAEPPRNTLATGPQLTSDSSLKMDKNTLPALALFITASIWQFQCHSLLASLRPLTTSTAVYVPPPISSLSFQLFLTPHYTAEILIYLSMFLVARNGTLFTAWIWVVTNLCVSAGETRQWARRKFGDREWGKWNVIPIIF